MSYDAYDIGQFDRSWCLKKTPEDCYLAKEIFKNVKIDKLVGKCISLYFFEIICIIQTNKGCKLV